MSSDQQKGSIEKPARCEGASGGTIAYFLPSLRFDSNQDERRAGVQTDH
jgi:hypothetical protein